MHHCEARPAVTAHVLVSYIIRLRASGVSISSTLLWTTCYPLQVTTWPIGWFCGELYLRPRVHLPRPRDKTIPRLLPIATEVYGTVPTLIMPPCNVPGRQNHASWVIAIVADISSHSVHP